MEKIKSLITELRDTSSSQERLLNITHSLILLLEDRNNYTGNPRIYPLPFFREFVHFLLLQHKVTSLKLNRKGNGVLFPTDGSMKMDIASDGHFYICSPGHLFPITIEKGKEYPFDIGLSFAGENRTIAEAISRKLRNKYKLTVFYDHEQKLKLMGKDLYDHLYEVYSAKCQLCLILFSKDYADKTWTRYELKAILARILQEKEDFAILISLDQHPLPKEFFSMHTVNLADTNIDSICEEICDRVWEKKRYHYFTAEELTDHFNMENRGNLFLNAYYEENMRETDDDRALVRIILLLILLFGDCVAPEIKGYFSYLVFSVPEIAGSFSDELCELFASGGMLKRHRGLKEILTVDGEYWRPFFEDRQAKKKRRSKK